MSNIKSYSGVYNDKELAVNMAIAIGFMEKTALRVYRYPGATFLVGNNPNPGEKWRECGLDATFLRVNFVKSQLRSAA